MSTVLRADAQRNLDRILDAACEAYAEIGRDVTISEIARRAGVGHGTVFRRFPTKDALRAAVIRRRLEELLAAAKVLLDRPDAGAALEEFVWIGAECMRTDRGLFEGVETCADLGVCDLKDELHDTVDKTIRRARRQGAIRGGVDARDIGGLVGAAVQAASHSERPDAWRRYVQVVLDGVRR